MRLLALLSLLALGCTGKRVDEVRYRKRVELMQSAFEFARSTQPLRLIGRDQKLPTLPGQQPIARPDAQDIFVLGAETVQWNDEGVTLAQLQDLVWKLPNDTVIYVAVDAALPVSQALPYLTVLRGRPLRFLLAPTRKAGIADAPPVGTRKFDATFRKLKPGDEDGVMRLVLQELYLRAAPCDPMHAQLEDLRARAGSFNELWQLVPLALLECPQAGVDVAAVEHIMLMPCLAHLPLPSSVDVDLTPRLLQRAEALQGGDIQALLPQLLAP